MIGKYDEEIVNEVGCYLASMWGGELIDAYFNSEDQEYVFNCIENGERFFTSLTEDDMVEYIEKLKSCMN